MCIITIASPKPRKNVNENYLKNTAIVNFKVVKLSGFLSKWIGLDNQHSMVFNLFNRPIYLSCFHFLSS